MKKPIKLLIAGSRTLSDYDTIEPIIDEFIKQNELNVEEIVSGGARGVDTIAEYYANKHKIKFKKFHAKWNEQGKAAGPIRNKQMAEYCNQAILIKDKKSESKGTFNMLNQMRSINKRVYFREV